MNIWKHVKYTIIGAAAVGAVGTVVLAGHVVVTYPLYSAIVAGTVFCWSVGMVVR